MWGYICCLLFTFSFVTCRGNYHEEVRNPSEKSCLQAQKSEESRLEWKRYVLVLPKLLMYHLNNLTNIADTFIVIINIFVRFVGSCIYDVGVEKSFFFSPCGMIIFKRHQYSINQWHILLLSEKFMLNITILKSYVPFSDACSMYSLMLYQLQEKSLKFCGHTENENVYSDKAIEVRLQVVDELMILVELYLRYSILDAGTAFNIENLSETYFEHNTNKLPCIQPIQANIAPSLIAMEHEKMSTYWYISSQLYNSNSTGNVYIEHPILTINFLTCSMLDSRFCVHHGFVTPYIAQWHSNPLEVILF
mgnify:CR=1 FL=1